MPYENGGTTFGFILMAMLGMALVKRTDVEFFLVYLVLITIILTMHTLIVGEGNV
jgi:hypothetical protein